MQVWWLILVDYIWNQRKHNLLSTMMRIFLLRLFEAERTTVNVVAPSNGSPDRRAWRKNNMTWSLLPSLSLASPAAPFRQRSFTDLRTDPFRTPTDWRPADLQEFSRPSAPDWAAEATNPTDWTTTGFLASVRQPLLGYSDSVLEGNLINLIHAYALSVLFLQKILATIRKQ